MRRLRIIMDTNAHTSDIVRMLATLKPQYLVFAEHELDTKNREDTLPPGLYNATEPLRLGREPSEIDPQEKLAGKVRRPKQQRPNGDWKRDVVYRASDNHPGKKVIDIEATMKKLGVTEAKLMGTKVPRFSSLGALKYAVTQRKIRTQRSKDERK